MAGFHAETARWRWLAAVPSVLGFAVALRCVWDFGRTGRGTPAPVAPPKRLVVVGFYRHVRNPMYVGFAAGWVGLWIVFWARRPGSHYHCNRSRARVHLFVVFYEEPVLRKKFGPEYEEYCENVCRWRPGAAGDSDLKSKNDVWSNAARFRRVSDYVEIAETVYPFVSFFAVFEP